jgi:hypothetical protein
MIPSGLMLIKHAALKLLPDIGLQYRSANDYRSNNSGQIGQQSGRNRVSCLFDPDRSKIDRRDVKRRLGAAVNRRGHQTDDVVGPKAMQHVGQQCQRRAPAQWPHQRERHEIGRKIQRRKNRAEQFR